MNNPPIIRKMTELDLDAVLAIETTCSVDPWTRPIFLACLERHHCYVLIWEHRVIGYAVLMFIEKECQLLNISISPPFQHKGFGRFFMGHLIEAARLGGATNLLLEVRCSNAPAIALYLEKGFLIVGHRKDYYLTLSGREDAHVMNLTLFQP